MNPHFIIREYCRQAQREHPGRYLRNCDLPPEAEIDLSRPTSEALAQIERSGREQFVKGLVSFMESHGCGNDPYVSKLKKSLRESG